VPRSGASGRPSQSRGRRYERGPAGVLRRRDARAVAWPGGLPTSGIMSGAAPPLLGFIAGLSCEQIGEGVGRVALILIAVVQLGAVLYLRRRHQERSRWATPPDGPSTRGEPPTPS